MFNFLVNFFKGFYSRFSKPFIGLANFSFFIISIFISFFININNDVLNLISVVLSIVIGLMFNFSSSLTDKISSDHLQINFKFRKERLTKLKLSFGSSYFSIYVSIISLMICLILNALPESHIIINFMLKIILLFFLIQMFLSFYFVLNDMKELVEYDMTQEEKTIEKKRKKSINTDDTE